MCFIKKIFIVCLVLGYSGFVSSKEGVTSGISSAPALSSVPRGSVSQPGKTTAGQQKITGVDQQRAQQQAAAGQQKEQKKFVFEPVTIANAPAVLQGYRKQRLMLYENFMRAKEAYNLMSGQESPNEAMKNFVTTFKPIVENDEKVLTAWLGKYKEEKQTVKSAKDLFQKALADYKKSPFRTEERKNLIKQAGSYLSLSPLSIQDIESQIKDVAGQTVADSQLGSYVRELMTRINKAKDVAIAARTLPGGMKEALSNEQKDLKIQELEGLISRLDLYWDTTTHKVKHREWSDPIGRSLMALSTQISEEKMRNLVNSVRQAIGKKYQLYYSPEEAADLTENYMNQFINTFSLQSFEQPLMKKSWWNYWTD